MILTRNSSMKSLSLFTVVAASGALFGCAMTPPPELVHARLTYQRASGGPAARLAPAQLQKAKDALANADSSFDKGEEMYRTRDFAYVATRKTEMANAFAAIESEKENKAQADREALATQTKVVARTKEELAASEKSGERTRKELVASEKSGEQARKDLVASEKSGEESRKELVASAKSGERTAAELAAERTARISAEKLAADALAALSKLAEVRQKERGLVITLSGSVLFASDKSALLPIAQARLSQVADALLATRERNLVVEGHTDSRGTKAHNMDLSQRRANSVRDYLTGRGYGAALIQANGVGEVRPISTNKTAEGRANNRRVEIIIQRAPVAMR